MNDEVRWGVGLGCGVGGGGESYLSVRCVRDFGSRVCGSGVCWNFRWSLMVWWFLWCGG